MVWLWAIEISLILGRISAEVTSGMIALATGQTGTVVHDLALATVTLCYVLSGVGPVRQAEPFGPSFLMLGSIVLCGYFRATRRRLGDAAALTDIKEIRHQGALGRLSASHILATAVVGCGVRLEAGPPNQRLQTDADLRFASGGAADP